MKKMIAAAVMLACLVPARPLFANDDFESWERFQVKILDTKYVDYINYWELRFTNDASDLSFWQTSQKIQIDPVKRLQFGLNHTYLENEVLNSQTKTNEFQYQHRLELEVNPYYNLTAWLNFKTRNRFEFRWIETKGSDNARYRHLDEFEFLTANWKPLKSIYVNSEFFVDFPSDQINEVRTTPVGFNFQIYKKTTLKIFYMIQTKKSARDWSSNQILGSHVSVAF